MLSGNAVAFILLAAGAALVLLAALAIFRHRPRSAVAALLDRGEFSPALAASHTARGATREDRYAGAVAAKHLLRFDRAAALLEEILQADPADGEAHLELGLVAAYQHRYDLATEMFRRAESTRADLAESLTLHRAWLALEEGRKQQARRLFDEVAVPLETKLRLNVGPRDPLLAEWCLQAAVLWRAFGDDPRARWAAAAGSAAAPASRLGERLGVHELLAHGASGRPVAEDP